MGAQLPWRNSGIDVLVMVCVDQGWEKFAANRMSTKRQLSVRVWGTD